MNLGRFSYLYIAVVAMVGFSQPSHGQDSILANEQIKNSDGQYQDHRPPRGHKRRPPPPQVLINQLDVSQQQRQQLLAIMQQQHQKRLDLHQQYRQARNDQHQAMENLHLETIELMRGVLDDDQLSQMQQLLEQNKPQHRGKRPHRRRDN